MKKSILIIFLILVKGCIFAQKSHIPKYVHVPEWQININASPYYSSLSSNKYAAEGEGEMGYSFGVDLVHLFKNDGICKLGYSIGLKYNQFNSSRDAALNYSVWATDNAGESVLITETGNVKEQQSASLVSLPLQLHVYFSLHKNFEIYLSPGIQFSAIQWGKYKSNGTVTRQGYYPLYNVTLYDIDVPGSEYYYPVNKQMSGSRALPLRHNGSLLAAFGLKYQLTPRYMFYTGVKTEFGVTSISNNSGSKMEEVGVVKNDATLNSLLNRGDLVRANAYGIELGIALNLGKVKNEIKYPKSKVKTKKHPKNKLKIIRYEE